MRDVSLQSVLVKRNSKDCLVVKLANLDFTFCFASADEQVLQQLFVPRALAPEIKTGNPCAFSADIWGLGLLIYKLISGMSEIKKID